MGIVGGSVCPAALVLRACAGWAAESDGAGCQNSTMSQSHQQPSFSSSFSSSSPQLHTEKEMDHQERTGIIRLLACIVVFFSIILAIGGWGLFGGWCWARFNRCIFGDKIEILQADKPAEAGAAFFFLFFFFFLAGAADGS